ncbi:MAG: BatA domain-containing protein, partial [Roseiarcus sp.]
MFGLPLAFAAPAVLVALVALGALYYFLRVTPPRPRQVVFPPLRLLLGLDDKETTPAKTPWPLLLLRLAIAAAVVLAMAGPIWNAAKMATGRAGALLVVFDDGWASAPSWDRRIAVAREAMSAATRAGRLAALAPISQGGLDVMPLDAANFESKLSALAPVPYAPPREAALAPIGRFLAHDPNAEILWIADGLELGG